MVKQLYCHAQVITMEEDKQGQIKTAQAVLVSDGKIEAVGEKAELQTLAGEDCERIDCGGGALLPSFIDPHSHLTALAQTLAYCDLSSATSFGQIVEQLVAFASQKEWKQGDWLIAFGYDHNNLEEKAHPDRHLLDQAAEKIKQSKGVSLSIAMTHASGHMGVMSTMALEKLGVDAQTPAPEGGVIGREADGTPSGYLEEKAFIERTAQLPKPSKEDSMRNIEQAQKIYWSYGITTIQDGLTKTPEWELLHEMAEQGRLHSDVVCYVDLLNHRDLAVNNPDYTGRYRHHLRIGGYKIFLDGSPQGRTAWMTQPYEGGTDCGYPIYHDAKVREFVEQSVKDGRQLLAHCNGDAAAQQYLDACRGVENVASIRPVMIHAQTLRPDQLPQLKEVGMIPSYFVAHTWFWGDVHLQNLGKQRAENISPLHATEELGIPYTLHQDTPVIPPDMLQTVWCAVNRRSKGGHSMGEAQKVSVAQALKAVTVSAAYQYFEEKEKGSIAPGKWADFVLLSENPLTQPPENIVNIDILKTFFHGKKLYDNERKEDNL